MAVVSAWVVMSVCRIGGVCVGVAAGVGVRVTVAVVGVGVGGGGGVYGVGGVF